MCEQRQLYDKYSKEDFQRPQNFNIQYSLFNKFQLHILWKITDEKLAVTEAPIVYPTVVLKILQ